MEGAPLLLAPFDPASHEHLNRRLGEPRSTSGRAGRGAAEAMREPLFWIEARQPLEAGREFLKMGAGPVNPAAAGAPAELFMIAQGERLILQWHQDLGFWHRLEQRVAVEASAVRRKRQALV